MRTKIPRFYVIILLLSIVLFVFAEWARPRKISWETSFSSHDKMPYGTYVLAKMLPQLFPGKQITVNNANYYEFLNDSSSGGIVIIHKEFVTDSYSVEALLDFVNDGGEVFISAFEFEQLLLDTLDLDLKYDYSWRENKIDFNFKDSRIKNDTNYTIKYQYSSYFNINSCNNCEAIGSLNNGHVNFIKIHFGDGTLFLNTTPLAFTNYNILAGNTIDYVEKSFSFMTIDNIVWDEFLQNHQTQNKSILQYISSNPSLKVAYYISTILLILFAVFYGKRRQKLIPIVEPLKNTSLDFVNTISKLYLQQQKNHDIANKLILYFLDYNFLRYKIRSRNLDEELIRKLSLRSGKNIDEVRSLIVLMQDYKKSTKISSTQLLNLNKKIENYKQL